MSMTATCVGFLFFMNCEFQEPPKRTTIICPPIIEWKVDIQKRAAAEIRTLPKGSASAELMARAIEQRNVVRRCHQERAKGK
jgi:hypothetical protein